MDPEQLTFTFVDVTVRDDDQDEAAREEPEAACAEEETAVTEEDDEVVMGATVGAAVMPHIRPHCLEMPFASTSREARVGIDFEKWVKTRPLEKPRWVSRRSCGQRDLRTLSKVPIGQRARGRVSRGIASVLFDEVSRSFPGTICPMESLLKSPCVCVSRLSSRSSKVRNSSSKTLASSTESSVVISSSDWTTEFVMWSHGDRARRLTRISVSFAVRFGRFRVF